jgi:hypothetical protein
METKPTARPSLGYKDKCHFSSKKLSTWHKKKKIISFVK